MRQGWMPRIAALAALALLALPAISEDALAAPRGSSVTRASNASTNGAARTRKAAKSSRQFTGYVTSIDKSSLTVERRGKNPRQMVFVKHDDMRTTGEVEKDARVTVYYRDEGGQTIAYRVIAKTARSRAKAAR